MKDGPTFDIPKNINHFLATLSHVYAKRGKSVLQKILVNSEVRVHEAWSCDNWNGGTYGHAIYLVIPSVLYIEIVEEKENFQKQIADDLNKVHNDQNEFIEQVFIETQKTEDVDWKKESGLLIQGQKIVHDSAIRRIWENDGFRIFLSHKSEVKAQTADVKKGLEFFGASCFVAHADIHPTREWQDEIENALASMDGFVALMSEGFHDSYWTDQEVGYAFARGIPILTVRLGRDPYGFIGKFQALSCDWKQVPKEIAKIFIQQPKMFASYLSALRKCASWDQGNALGEILDGIRSLTESQINEIILAYNETEQLHGSWRFNGSYPKNYGPGLISYLHKWGTRKYIENEKGLIHQEVSSPLITGLF